MGWSADDHDLGECRDPALVADALARAREQVAAPPLPGNGCWRRNPPGTTEDHAAHFMALAAHH